jgi:hypothetical protein
MISLEKLMVACVLSLALLSCRGDVVSGAESALTVTPREVVFGRVWVGRRATAHLTLRNEGRAPVDVTLSTEPPFSTLSDVRLGGGEEREVDVTLDAERAGPLTDTLQLGWNGSTLEVPLSADVAAIPFCPAADCRDVTFDPTTGACVDSIAADGTACGAGDQCLVGGACVAGACMGQARDCSDGNACTADSCDSTTGCRHDEVSKACPLSTNPCLAPVCEPLSGCGLLPVTDGTACGPNDCTTARVCVVGTCVNRTSPEGSTCAPRTTCREAGVCHGQQCEVPPAAPMMPRWRYEPPAGHTLKFFGAVDDEGNAFATESWIQSDTGNIRDVPVTALVSITRDGVVRFKEVVISDCTSCQYGLALAVDTAGRRVFLNTRLMLQARSLDDGRLLWTQDVSQGVPTYDRRPDGGGSFWLSAPVLVGDTLVGVPLSEGVNDHHAYVRTFDRSTGAPDWQLHKKGHLYGVGVDHTGELWLSSANCWAAAGELTRVAPSGVAQATRFHELYPSTAWAGFGIGRTGNTAWLIDRTLSLTNLSTMGVPASPSAVLIRDNELITWDGVNGLMATDVTNGTHRFRTRGLEVGASPDFQLVRDGGVAWTGSYTDGGVLGAIDGQGAPLLSCVLPTKAESATAIVRGVAYVFGNGGLSGFSVPELDVESSGWVASNGSPARSGRAR